MYPEARVKYQKSNSGGPEYNVTDSEGENDLEVKVTKCGRASGKLVSRNPNITDISVGSIKQTHLKGDRYGELARRSVSSDNSKRMKETVAMLLMLSSTMYNLKPRQSLAE